MVFRRTLCWLPLWGGLALLAGLAFPTVSQAQKHPKSPPPAPKHGHAASPTGATLHFEEAEMLRKAFILLAGANHNYNGHRGWAMNALKAGCQILDDGVLKHGSASQKAATKRENAVAGRAEIAARRTPAVHEPQAVSDAQLRMAGELLAQVRPMLVTHKQKRVLGHVDTAIKEITLALKVR